MLIIQVFFGARMKQDYQDDSYFSSWYPIKTAVELNNSIANESGLGGGGHKNVKKTVYIPFTIPSLKTY